MDKLAAEQSMCGKTIEKIFSNFKKDSKSRKTLSYLECRLQKLNFEWNQFERRDIELQKTKAAYPDHYYFSEHYYQQVEKVYEELKSILENSIAELEDVQSARTNSSNIDQPQHQERKIRVQKAAIAAVTRLINSTKEDLKTSQSRSYCQHRLQSLRSYWDGIVSNHNEIIEEEDTYDYTMEMFYGIEDQYNSIITKLLEQDSGNIISADNIRTTNSDAENISQPQVKLPKIALPVFTGDYMKWRQFCDLFEQLIHRQSMGSAQKMFYLKANVTGEAGRLIQHLQVSDDNYNTAWEILKDRYANKRLIVSAFLNNLLTLSAISTDSAASLKKLHDVTKESLLGISSQGINTSNWDPLVLHLLLQKVDKETHRLFEQSLTTPREVQKLSTFLEFLETRFQMLETLGNKTEKAALKLHKPSSLLSVKKNNLCTFCKRHPHPLRSCEKFLQLPPQQRATAVKDMGLCVNCLRSGHHLRKCPSRNCLKCNYKHHTLLHNPSFGNTANDSKNQDNSSQHTKPSSAHTASRNEVEHRSYVFLATASLIIYDKFQHPVECRAVLDSGSQLSFISDRLVKKLGLNGKIQPIHIDGIGASKLKTQNRVNIHIKSRLNEFSARIEAFALPEITSHQPRQDINIEGWNIPENIRLADPDFNKSKRIDLLLGAELYSELMCVGQIRLRNDLPILQNTTLGWIVLGKTVYEEKCQERFCGISTSNLSNQLEKFWLLEETVKHQQSLTLMEQRCEEHFNENTRRTTEGRFIVALPFVRSPSNLGDSREIALRRFLNLERKLNKDEILKSQYMAFMKEYLELGHMKEVKPGEIPAKHYFLPHHSVVKPESTTTKLRVVFDASCKTSSDISLNDILMVGPTIQDDLFAILLRFRLYKYVFTADIAKMYRQIQVTEADQNFQLIIWRNNPEEDLKYYRLTTVTYGTSAAPYLATKCIQRIADIEATRYPLGAQRVKTDLYMDDAITGSNSLTEVLEIRNQMIRLLKNGGFILRKWCANHPKLLENITASDLELKLELGVNEDQHIKTLGLIWFPQKDHFAVKTNLIANKRITKRSILADISHVYDPLGLVNPVITTAKIFLQQLWSLKLDWDVAIPQELNTKWEMFRSELKKLNSLTIPRHVLSKTKAKRIELHAFSDASEKAYGAAVYIRTIDQSSKITVNLLCAKSRVAPLKKTTLPRLELCAAVISSQLVARLKEILHIKIDRSYYWTDSSITLSWIQSEPARFKTFVANRVTTIQELTKTTEWKHINTKLNPADLVSRGMHPEQLLTSSFWFNGPSFLQQQENKWPKDTILPTLDKGEIKEVKFALTATIVENNLVNDINHKGSFKRLQKIIGFLRRFINNLKLKVKKIECISDRNLSVSEEYEALALIIKAIQQTSFGEEIIQLEKTGAVKPNSKLSTLTPFLDDKHIIRVGGRLQSTNLPYDTKHPILLPNSHPLVILLVKELHERHLHAGPQALTAIIRQQFWPLRAKSLAQSTVHSCIKCSRAKPQIITQLMGNLPPERVQPNRPFVNVGIDFCGPMEIHYKIRGKKPTKAYIAVFVCFATKAVHLELVSDLTTDSFIGCLKRFIARRGRPAKIFCDNATNFVGAHNKLRDLYMFFYKEESQKEILRRVAEEQIQWCFIPPRSPHFGGLWEAAVKSAKYHLKRIASSASLTYEELYTVITEIEAILNSRPITAISSDPNDLQALTPAHFLIGEPLTSVINPYATAKEMKLLKRWELVRSLQQEFWKRWTKEYLQELQLRHKWHQKNIKLAPGSLVLIKDENLPPLQWPLGRIIKEHKGSDGLTRVVEIKTAKGVVKRAIHKLSLLPIEGSIEKQPEESTYHRGKEEEKETQREKESNFVSLKTSINPIP